MTYSEVSFIFFSLAVFLCCSNVRLSLRTGLLLATSALWYFSWGKTGLLTFSLIIFFNYLAILFSFKIANVRRTQFFFILTSLNVLIFFYLKLAPFFWIDNTTPYGTSFFMLIILGSIIDHWRENRRFQKSDTLALLTMPVFFPLLLAGPIERGKHLIPQLKKPTITLEGLYDGILIFSIGFLKKRYISDYLFESSLLRVSSGNIIADALLHTFLIYVELSSYCDMGRGAAKTLGINLSVNFRAFYYSKNPNDFWQRWNITLGTWIRDYVTFPLMFRFGRKINPNIIIIFSFLLVGLWHGLTLNWLIFGLFNGLIICFYRLVNQKTTSRFHGPIFSICIWIGLGIFQDNNFWANLKSPFHLSPHFDLSEINISFFAPTLLLFFAFEFFQEKKKDLDFFLKWSPIVKYSLAILLIILFFYGLRINAFLESKELPPLYFQI